MLIVTDPPSVAFEEIWPWHHDDKRYPRNTAVPEQTRIRELTKAGALIAAEIDRLQRKAERDD